MRQERLPVDCQSDPSGDPREQLHTEFSLQARYPLRRTLLGDSEILGSGLELADFRNGDEGADRVDIHNAEHTLTTMDREALLRHCRSQHRVQRSEFGGLSMPTALVARARPTGGDTRSTRRCAVAFREIQEATSTLEWMFPPTHCDVDESPLCVRYGPLLRMEIACARRPSLRGNDERHDVSDRTLRYR
ncbi:hypothetical protein GCM10023336_65160 [Streptomyces similanensis]|uniref:Uncharacterized protein n=1 Tax=Streptomyces similanensis TaxID=1274988 RepID=A0ABP9LHW8_9ACTN